MTKWILHKTNYFWHL